MLTSVLLLVVLLLLQRPLNTRDPVSLAGRDTNYRNTPISWKGPKHEKCIVDKVMVTSECLGEGGGQQQRWWWCTHRGEGLRHDGQAQQGTAA